MSKITKNYFKSLLDPYLVTDTYFNEIIQQYPCY